MQIAAPIGMVGDSLCTTTSSGMPFEEKRFTPADASLTKLDFTPWVSSLTERDVGYPRSWPPVRRLAARGSSASVEESQPVAVQVVSQLALI
jgi:hypothetical protein